MREKKYANVLLNNEEKDKFKKISEAAEEEIDIDGVKLSLTRELKFRKLHDKDEDITKEDLNKELNEDYDLTDTSERKIINKKFENFFDGQNNITPTISDRDEKGELMMPKVKGEKRIIGAYEMSEPEEEHDEKVEDDIYLTRAFQPLKKRFNIMGLVKGILVILMLVVVCLSLYFFAITPLYNLYINSKPMMIFDNMVSYLADENEKIIDMSFANDGLYANFNFDFNLKGSSENLYIINDNNFIFNLGVDSRNKQSEMSYYLMNNSNKYGYRHIYDGKNSYINVVGNDNYYNTDNINDGIEGKVKDILKPLNKVNKSDLISANNILRDVIIDIINKEKISSYRDVIEVRGEETKVKRNTLEFNKASWNKFIDKFIDKTVNNKKYIDIITSYLGMTSEEYKNVLKDEYFSEEHKLRVNIYTKKGTDVVGFDIEKDDFRLLYWYKNQAGDFEGYLNLTDECKDNKCNDERKVISFVGIKNNDNTNVRINYNDKEKANLVIKKFNDKKVDLDYIFYHNNEQIKGVIDMSLDNKQKKHTINISLNYKDISGDVKILVDNYDSNVEVLNNINSVEYNKYSLNEDINKMTDNKNIEEYLNKFEEILIKYIDYLYT